MEYDLKKLAKCDRVAIMGGTFDPVHMGHLLIAETARERFDIDTVLFVPSGVPPHKRGCAAAAKHRFNMITLAIRGNKHFAVSSAEQTRTGVSYAIDTIREIRAFMRDGAQLYFIIGADTAALVRTWKEYEIIESLATFIVLPRPGFDHTVGIPQNAVSLEAHALDISSTYIRENIGQGRSVRYLIPAEVEKYIKNHELYKICRHTIPQIVGYLEQNLPSKRYHHSLSVYEAAARLAIHWRADEKKTAVAALLHDIAKDFTAREKTRLCAKYGIKRAGILKQDIELTHPLIGARIAAEYFGVKDQEILNAIKYHTTGRKDMTLIEKIVFIADLIEPGRFGYTELDELRTLAYDDIDRAVALGLKAKMEYTKKAGKKIHPLSVEALESV